MDSAAVMMGWGRMRPLTTERQVLRYAWRLAPASGYRIAPVKWPFTVPSNGDEQSLAEL